MKKIILLTLLLMVIISTRAQEISKLEYFVDNDPGFGNATNIPVSQGYDVSAGFTIDTTGFSPGIHMLAVRAMGMTSEGENAWSVVSSSLFFTVDLDPVTTITKLEYFIDSDPGFDLATDIPITTGSNVSASFIIDTAGLVPGIHMLVVRAKQQNSSGAEIDWSTVASSLFYTVDLAPLADITRMEYFVDDDPGYGNGTEIPVTPGQNLTLTFPIDSTGWTAGDHTFFLRIKNSAGDWSLVNSFSFPVPFQRSWKGVISDEWNRVQNWNPPGIPASTEDLVIKGDAIHMPVIRIEGLSCNALEVEPGATMTIQQPNTFMVTGN